MFNNGKRQPATLVFIDDRLERDYRREVGIAGLRSLRAGLVVGISMWIALSTAALLARIHNSHVVFATDLFLVLPFLGAALVVTRWSKTFVQQQWISAIAVSVSGLIAEYQAWQLNFGHYGADIMIFLGFVSFILFRLRFFVTTLATIPMFILFLWLRFHADGSLLDYSYATAAMILVSMGGYRIEASSREAFYQKMRVTADRLGLESEAREGSVQELRTLAVLKEREALAHELHDTVTQKLAFLGMAIGGLEAELAASAPEALVLRLRQLAGIADEAQGDVRDIIRDVRSASVLSKGLLSTLSEYVSMLDSEYGIKVEVENHYNEADIALLPSQKVGAFKAVQEALNNCRKHSGLSEARVAITKAEDCLRIEVIDEGRGFDPKSHIASNHYGLDIMETRTRQSGGRSTIHSVPGKGTRVVFEYPLDPRVQESTLQRAAGPEAKAEPGHPSISIIVVDDHDLFREGLCGLLRLGGYSVIGSASTAAGGLELARGSPPEVVILDIRMRDTDGIQAAASFKEEFPDLGIILLTGSPSPEDILRASKVGASAFMLKSIQAHELFDSIDEVRRGRSVFGPEMARRALAGYGPAGSVSSMEALNVRQREILKLVAGGLTYKEIGIKLHLAESTIKFHMGEILVLLQVRNKAEAARVARDAGL